MRVFLITDLLCITINDGPDRDFAVSLRLCELPLNFGNPFVYYIQVNSKQIALKIDIDQDKSLVPPDEVDDKERSAVGGLMEIMQKKLAIQYKTSKDNADVKHDLSEVMAKVRELAIKDKPAAIRMLKQAVNEQKAHNK